MKDYEKKIRTQDKLRTAALLLATVTVLAGIFLRDLLPWLLYLSAIPLACMIVSTLLIRHYEKKRRAEEE